MQASCGPCTGDPWRARAGGGVLARMRLRHSSKSVAGEVHDVEGIHDRPRVGEFFGGCALEPGESIHRDDLDTARATCRGWEASQVLKTFLERPGTMSRSREGPLRSRMGVKSKMTVTYLSP